MNELEKQLCIVNYLSGRMLDNKATTLKIRESIKRYEDLIKSSSNKKLVKDTHNSISELCVIQSNLDHEYKCLTKLVKELNIDSWLDQTSVEEQIKVKQLLDLERG